MDNQRTVAVNKYTPNIYTVWHANWNTIISGAYNTFITHQNRPNA